MKHELVTVEILVIGNELLNGTTLDTNSHWLSIEIEKIGARLTRKTTVPDDLAVITRAFKECLSRKPSWIISLGGLGPTFDDITLEALALATRRPLALDKIAVNYMKDSYERRNRSRRLNKASLKMAIVPKGSIPLRNPVGSASGVLLEIGPASIVSLPGVPKEMKAIFQTELASRMKKEILPSSARKQEWINALGVRESQIAPYLKKIMDSSKGVYVKSHPLGFRKGKSVLHFQLISEKGADLARVSQRLTQKIISLGGSIR
ncbi:MAG: competence/damage-inducible protein A [Nitrososphaerales archaeon]